MSAKDTFLLNCIDCEAEFFTKGESNFYRKKGLHIPKRCKSCREKKKAERKQLIEEIELENVLANLQFEQIKDSEIHLSNSDTSLFIVGNGFDLMHGVPSSYYKFRDFLGRHSDLREALETYIKKNDLWADFEESLAYLDDDAMLNTVNDWMDIFNVKDQHDDDFSAADFFMASELAMAPTHFIIRELPKSFRKWVVTLQPNIFNKPLKHILNTQSRFINFNYTEFLETIYDVPNENVFYIHGDRRNKNKEFILGHSDPTDPEMDVDSGDQKVDRLRMKSQTTFDLHETAGYQLSEYYTTTTKKSSDVIEANRKVFGSFFEIETIVVIGHSLSKVDYPYFKEIIKNNENAMNMKWIISWYSASDIKRVEDFASSMRLQPKQIKLFKV